MLLLSVICFDLKALSTASLLMFASFTHFGAYICCSINSHSLYARIQFTYEFHSAAQAFPSHSHYYYYFHIGNDGLTYGHLWNVQQFPYSLLSLSHSQSPQENLHIHFSFASHSEANRVVFIRPCIPKQMSWKFDFCYCFSIFFSNFSLQAFHSACVLAHWSCWWEAHSKISNIPQEHTHLLCLFLENLTFKSNV